MPESLRAISDVPMCLRDKYFPVLFLIRQAVLPHTWNRRFVRFAECSRQAYMESIEYGILGGLKFQPMTSEKTVLSRF